MVRELEIIFRLDAIALELRVASERLVLLEELRRIAAGAVVLPIALLGLVRARSATAATATAVSVSPWAIGFR